MTEWMGDAAPAIAGPVVRTGDEGTKAERRSIDDMRKLRVRIEQHLEAPIDEMAIDAIRAYTAADAVACFKHHAGQATGLQRLGAGEPGKSTTDHRHIDHAHASAFPPHGVLDRDPERLGAFAAAADPGFRHHAA